MIHNQGSGTAAAKEGGTRPVMGSTVGSGRFLGAAVVAEVEAARLGHPTELATESGAHLGCGFSYVDGVSVVVLPAPVAGDVGDSDDAHDSAPHGAHSTSGPSAFHIAAHLPQP